MKPATCLPIDYRTSSRTHCSSERAAIIRLVIPRFPLRTIELKAVHVPDPFVCREFTQFKPLLPRIDSIPIHTEIAPRFSLLAPTLGFGPPDGPLAHLAPVPVLDAHPVQVHLRRLPLAREEEAPPAALLAEEPVDESVVAGIVSELGHGIQRGEEHKVLGGPGHADVEVAGLVAGRAVAAVELLVGAGGVGGRGRGDGGGFVGECEEDDVLDRAAVTGAVEGAACWCRVAHLAGGGDVIRDCSLVLRVAGTNT
jgi:hypothetical protein